MGVNIKNPSHALSIPQNPRPVVLCPQWLFQGPGDAQDRTASRSAPPWSPAERRGVGTKGHRPRRGGEQGSYPRRGSPCLLKRRKRSENSSSTTKHPWTPERTPKFKWEK
ncbi:hypothetical protein NEUTE1DRAFT_102768 [Neurospora tetrasperma FGSC 2508]|uniref:Uncharacterized protein n=1 Tax=Neurospora tetrasperma (strain FGSC 2508 / ATCC MYA-4615 / P0657) TaxID=510951 RepID=F8MTK2_NEUT8|nr:uncharacterized protein NEUTE1DRAFT_102768 [Neurospora tetrasperma FGSC 2508]EGO55334.1 hypothetical protein NEUTE1DRAFT_102768 [Neurospora tetrasperma FGSC 2508]EGZ69443.1 hypothetical protein NEUTE2DRAFT_131842 [Neurospora tetrasperma FGSC 2509]